MNKNRIKSLAAEAGISIPDLAAAISAHRGKNMSAAALRCYTRVPQERQPDKKLAQTIGDILKCSPEEVMGVEARQVEITQTRLPLYGSAAAGLGVDTTNTTSPIDYIDAHPGVTANKDAYAIYVSGDSMEPRFRSGEIVFCNPGQPPRRGDDVVVQLHPAAGNHTAIVKRFVSSNAEEITLHQFNPDKDLKIKTESVVSINVIIGTSIK